MPAAYSFMDVVCNLTGPTGTINLGYGAKNAKEGIEFAPANDSSHMEVGADGQGQHNLHADKSGQLTVRLLKTSPVNAQLHAAYDAQRANPALHGLNTIVCEQKRAGDISTAQQAAFKKKPRLVYSEDAQLMEWEFDAIMIDTVLGTY